MGNVTRSKSNNITSPNGNSLALFVDGESGVMQIKDVRGNVQDIMDFIPIPTPELQSLQDVIDVDKNADRVRFFKDVFQVTQWTACPYVVKVKPSLIDDKFYVYGEFTYGGTKNDIARFNADGTYDDTFVVGSGFNNNPFLSFDMLPLADGTIYIAGFFTSSKGISARRILKLNNDGTIDASFDYGTGFNRYTTALALDSNDKLYIGGDFASYKGVTSNRLIRLNPDGSRDNTFDVGVGFNNAVIDVTVDSSDKIYVTGYFTTFQGVSAKGILRLNSDGSRDNTFDVGTGFNNAGNNVTIFTLITSDNKIVANGLFNGYKGISANGVIKLNLDGSIDSDFLDNSGTGFTVASSSYDSVEVDNKLLISGSFTSYNGVVSNNVIQLNLDGTIFKVYDKVTNFGSAYVVQNNRLLVTQFLSGKYIISELQDDYPVNVKELTFDEITGKAEYKIGGLDSASEQELLPKRLVRDFIQEIAVPYTGATTDVDLGEKGLQAGYFKFDTTPTDTPEEQGVMFWDEDDNTVDVILNGYKMKIGEDTFYPVKNQSGSTILKGTNVKFAGTVGASSRLLILPFLADGTDPSYVYMGVTAEDILDGEDGKVLWFGRLRGLNTNAFNENDILYASTTVAGGFQTAIPTGANNIVQVSAVIKKSINQGVIFIRPQIEPFQRNSLNTRVTANINGTYDIDWSAGEVFVLTVTGNVIISDINLPTGTNTKVIELLISGNFSVTLPVYWEAFPSNDTYNGLVRNYYVVSCINGTTSSEDVIYSLKNLS
jgi:uncharacterized delta-60 repeat protein